MAMDVIAELSFGESFNMVRSGKVSILWNKLTHRIAADQKYTMRVERPIRRGCRKSRVHPSHSDGLSHHSVVRRLPSLHHLL